MAIYAMRLASALAYDMTCTREVGLAIDGNEAGLNRSIEDVVSLMEQEVERLKLALDALRLARAAPQRIRWHIDQIDHRQLVLDELRRMIQH